MPSTKSAKAGFFCAAMSRDPYENEYAETVGKAGAASVREVRLAAAVAARLAASPRAHAAAQN